MDDNLVEEHLKVELDGDTLHIGSGAAVDLPRRDARGDVTMPGLTGLEANGASTVSASGFASGDPLALTASGVGAMT